MGETLPDLPGVGGFHKNEKSKTRNKIIEYLMENGPSTAAQIADRDLKPSSISLCLRTNLDLFERVGKVGIQRAIVWKLRKGDNSR